MEYTDKFTEEHFIEFKEHFILLAEEEFYACNHFIEHVIRADSPSKLKYVLIHFADEIYDKLHGEHDTSELESEINNLECMVEELESKMYDHEKLFPTVYDEMKFKTFVELHSKYTPWELEQLLLNGKL
jgi:hypothetical protein